MMMWEGILLDGLVVCVVGMHSERASERVSKRMKAISDPGVLGIFCLSLFVVLGSQLSGAGKVGGQGDASLFGVALPSFPTCS